VPYLGKTSFRTLDELIHYSYKTRRGAVRLARQAHNLEVVGSNPTAATPKPLGNQGFFRWSVSSGSVFSALSGHLGAR